MYTKLFFLCLNWYFYINFSPNCNLFTAICFIWILKTVSGLFFFGEFAHSVFVRELVQVTFGLFTRVALSPWSTSHFCCSLFLSFSPPSTPVHCLLAGCCRISWICTAGRRTDDESCPDMRRVTLHVNLYAWSTYDLLRMAGNVILYHINYFMLAGNHKI